MGCGELFVDGDIPRSDGQDPAIRHRIACVHRQVEKNLLDLSSISSHGLEGARSAGDQLHVFTDGSAKQGLDFGDDVVDVEDLEVSYLSPSEGEELVGEPGSSIRGRGNLGDVAEHGGQTRSRVNRSGLQFGADLL